MSVELIGDQALWDEFVERSPYGLLFHRWDFLRIMEKHTRYQLFPYGIYRGNELICIFPLFYRYYNGLNMVFSPPPLTSVPYLGPVMAPVYDTLKQRRKETYLNTISDGIEAEIKRFTPDYTNFSFVPKFKDVRPFKWNGYNSEIFYTYYFSLDGTIESIWNNLDRECKKAIKASEDLGLTLRESNDTDTYYDIVKERYIEQGLNVPLISRTYLKELESTFPNEIKLYYLYKSDQIINIAINIEYKNKFIYWLGGVNLDKSIYSLEYLLWEIIKMKKSQGFTEMEIEGANVKRICAFKSKFNPTLAYAFNVYKKGFKGELAEFAYKNFIRKRWI